MARKGRRESLNPDLTPLIDVVFLLLIFFLVSSVFKKEELALLLQLPKTEQGESSKSKIKQMTIELSQTDMAVDGKKVNLKEMAPLLQGAEKKTLVNLRVGGDVKYQKLVRVLDLLQKFKLENVSLITEKGKLVQ